jgi:poly(3-hydroxybutyrate) depolymerase
MAIKHSLGRCAASFALCLPASVLAQVQAGPGVWSDQQSWAADSVNGGTLSGYVYWPASQPVLGGKRALVMVLHGCQQTAAGDVIDTGADKGFNWTTVAERYGALILAPNATGNVSGSHCWDYSLARHQRTSGHDGVLLNLVSRFLGDARYAIDPRQVYVTGLSSGGAQSMVLACLAPDVFAGVGINAGPPPGTTTLQIGSVPSGFTATTAAGKCTAMAGAEQGKFATQIASVIWGSNDYTVAPAYGPLDAAAMRIAYGGVFSKGAAVALAGGGSNTPYTDNDGKLRTSEIVVSGMGHAWPAGPGGQNGHFVDATRVDYPAFLMDFWFKNNLRAHASGAPRMTACKASVSGNAATISGAAVDGAASGAGAGIGSYRVVLNGTTPVNDPAAGSGAAFSIGYALANGNYSGSVSATSAASGQVSPPCALAQFLVGPPPPLQPPAGLKAGTASASSIALSWNPASGASGYALYRNGSKLTPQPLAATAYTDSGLAASTSYNYQVSSLAGALESGLSPSLSASTASAFRCSTSTASNFAHVQAGRAEDSGGHALARGSHQDMGLNNLFYSQTLAQTSAAYYIIGNCP